MLPLPPERNTVYTVHAANEWKKVDFTHNLLGVVLVSLMLAYSLNIRKIKMAYILTHNEYCYEENIRGY